MAVLIITEAANAVTWTIRGNHYNQHENRRRGGESPYFHFRTVCLL